MYILVYIFVNVNALVENKKPPHSVFMNGAGGEDLGDYFDVPRLEPENHPLLCKNPYPALKLMAEIGVILHHPE